ncbi:hypothetical protein WDV06_36740 [Streptomyces racemochromogenes]|uniref:Uncharacterized protein n=1 Tax=Streptomyces racemochromogenes TaxID=67353 RepID=A0ABW7PRN4_9ACTN
MQAIVTKYLGPTEKRNSVIKATAAAGSTLVNYNHALSLQENHRRAAAILSDKFGWNTGAYGTLVMGGLPNGSFAHVFTKE